MKSIVGEFAKEYPTLAKNFFFTQGEGERIYNSNTCNYSVIKTGLAKCKCRCWVMGDNNGDEPEWKVQWETFLSTGDRSQFTANVSHGAAS